jgi:hypothetical protein
VREKREKKTKTTVKTVRHIVLRNWNKRNRQHVSGNAVEDRFHVQHVATGMALTSCTSPLSDVDGFK